MRNTRFRSSLRPWYGPGTAAVRPAPISGSMAISSARRRQRPLLPAILPRPPKARPWRRLRAPNITRTASSPPLMAPLMTSCAPYQSTPTTLPKIMKMAAAVSMARRCVRETAASKERSTAFAKRAETASSEVKACMVRVADRFSRRRPMRRPLRPGRRGCSGAQCGHKGSAAPRSAGLPQSPARSVSGWRTSWRRTAPVEYHAISQDLADRGGHGGLDRRRIRIQPRHDPAGKGRARRRRS